MNNILVFMKWLGGMVCGIITYLFGGIDAVFIVLLAMIVLDYITGIMVAIIKKNLSSSIGFNGIFKKIAILLVVSAGYLIGQSMGVPEVRSIVIGFYIVNEGISITENAGNLGVPLPKKLIEILQQLKLKDGTEK